MKNELFHTLKKNFERKTAAHSFPFVHGNRYFVHTIDFLPFVVILSIEFYVRLEFTS